MRIETLDYVSGRTTDGRVYSAMQGAVTDVDDADTGMVDLMRSLAARGLVRIHGEPDTDSDERDGDDEAETKDGTAQPAEVKQARLDPQEAALRVRADELGIKVDRRWGAERLRAEVARAEAAQ